jgi:TatD DNase family protein
VHPHHAEEWDDRMQSELCALIKMTAAPKSTPPIAVGEIGLDYYYEYAPRQAQRQMFLDQVQLAHTFSLPVVLHCRDAWDEMLEMIEKHDIGRNGGILHCFAGNADQGRRAIEAGLHLGVGGILTFNKSEAMRRIIRELGPDHLVLETDAPYLAPTPRRGKTNEPSYLVHTARFLAELLGIELNKLQVLMQSNSRKALRCETL